MHEISTILETIEADVRILNRGDLEFLFQVITDGKLLLSTDENKRVQFEKRIFFENFDFKPVLDTYYYYMRKRIKETGQQ